MTLSSSPWIHWIALHFRTAESHGQLRTGSWRPHFPCAEGHVNRRTSPAWTQPLLDRKNPLKQQLLNYTITILNYLVNLSNYLTAFEISDDPLALPSPFPPGFGASFRNLKLKESIRLILSRVNWHIITVSLHVILPYLPLYYSRFPILDRFFSFSPELESLAVTCSWSGICTG